MSTIFNRVPKQSGFTLIEVMIVVVIVGILAAIALPSYTEYVRRSKIIDGTVKLGDFRSQMEKYFLDNRTYQVIPASGSTCGLADPPTGAGDNFAVSVSCPTATTYTITATGVAGKNMAGFVFAVTQSGVKSSSGPGGYYTASTCWAVRKDGTCQ